MNCGPLSDHIRTETPRSKKFSMTAWATLRSDSANDERRASTTEHLHKIRHVEGRNENNRQTRPQIPVMIRDHATEVPSTGLALLLSERVAFD